MNWETVYVFISSTFNDMHAERDYLVKQIFPELRMWCAKRKLKLVDVDLRWGVSAADAQENKRVVEVCIKNIDKCRPFFLCFMGQRRGWVPEAKDVNPETLSLFPELEKHLGKNSITELEILHALIHPFSADVAPVEHARFYFRDKSYLKQIKTSAHKDLFCPKKSFFSRTDSENESFKNSLRKEYSVVDYTATWNSQKPSPELTGELSQGRLENFCVKNNTLGHDVLTWLQNEIAETYPDHTEITDSDSPLALELDRQDTQLFQASDAYITRPFEENALIDLINEDADTPILLLADAGCGKTSLLAHMINTLKTKQLLYYRFVGTTPHSFNMEDLAASLVSQWVSDGLLSEEEAKYNAGELAFLFPHLLKKAGSNQPFLLILDGMDQLTDNMGEQFLPHTLPAGCKLIFSLRSDSEYIPDKNVRVHHLGMMNKRDDKIHMIKNYLGTFLKDVDDTQLEQLLSMEGSDNPLYMKIVLNELRQHGSFETLFEMLSKNYGATPLEAFCEVIYRVQRNLLSQGVPDAFANIFFGSLACTHEAMDGDLFYRTATRLSDNALENMEKQEICDLVYSLARELEPFLVLDGNKILLRYDSLRRAYNEIASPYLPINHGLLSVAFAERAMEDNCPHYMECAMYHISNAIEGFIPLYFQAVNVMIWAIRHNGAKLLATTMRNIARDRGLSDFENPAQVLFKTSSRLDMYPETLFMELRRYGDINNPIIKHILDQENEYAYAKYLIPLGDPGAASLIQEEYIFSKKVVNGMEYNEPYYVIYSEDILKIVDRRTSEPINIYHMEPRRDANDRFHITAGDDLLYVSCWNQGKLTAWKCYSLPELSLISKCDNPCISQTNVTALKVVDQKLYAFFNTASDQTTDNYGHTLYPHQPALVCINSGETLFSATFNDDCSYKFPGKYLILRDAGSGKWMIVRTIDGKILIEDKFLGYENVPRIDHLAGGANLYADLGKTLCVWLAGVDVINGETQMVYDIRNYNILENSELKLARSSNSIDVSCSGINVLSSGHILTESRGVISILDENMDILGYYDLGDPVISSESWAGKIHLEDKDTLLIFRSRKVQKISFSHLLSQLKAERPAAKVIMCDAAIRNGWFYVFDQKLSRTDLITLRKQTADGDAGLIERICPWTTNDLYLYSKCISTAYDGLHYTVHDMEMRIKPTRFCVENPSQYMLLHAFYYYDKNKKMILGNVVADRKPCRHMYRGKEETFFHCHLHILKEDDSCNLKWYKQDLGIDIMGTTARDIRVESIRSDFDNYVVFPNIYKNEDELELRVYCSSDFHCLFNHAMPVMIGTLHLGYLYCYKSGLIFGYRKNDTSFFGHLDLEQMQLLVDTSGRQPFKSPIRDDYVYLHQQGSLTIDIYSLNQRGIVKTFTLTDREHILVKQILRVKNYLIVQSFNSDLLEVYDYDSGTQLFVQRMEQVIENLYFDSKSKKIVMLDSNQRVYIWEMKK